MTTGHGLTSEPITGDEELGDRSLPAQALAEFYKAFNTRDLALMAENLEPSAEGAMDNPVGGVDDGQRLDQALLDATLQRVLERSRQCGADQLAATRALAPAAR